MRKKVVLTTIAPCGLLLAFMSHVPTNETMTTKRRDVITSTLISISNTVFEDGQLELADVRSRGVRVCSQRERLTHLHDACARHRNRMSVALLAPANRSVVDDIHGMLYCFLSKVGCTAMKIAIAKANAHHMGPHSYKHLPEPGKPMMVHHTKKMSRLGLNLMSEFNEEESRRRVDRYFKFMILRHPLDRLVSVWRDKLVHINQSELVYRKWPAEILRKYRPKEFARVFGDRSTVRYQALYDHFGVPRFDEFLTWVAELGLRNDHWLSAVDACHVCAHPWDAILKLETLDDDQGIVYDRLGKDYQPGSIEYLHSYSGRVGVFNPIRQLDLYGNISTWVMDYFQDLYRLDMELFGYHWDMASHTAICAIRTDDGYCC